MSFKAITKEGHIKYSTDVLSQKSKFAKGLIIRKIRCTRQVFNLDDATVLLSEKVHEFTQVTDLVWED